jgi:hypothetical protein
MDKKNWIWVISGSGKALHLVDMTTPLSDKEVFAMKITQEMAERKHPVQVPNNRFFAGHLALGNIIQVNLPEKKEKVVANTETKRGRPPKEEQ